MTNHPCIRHIPPRDFTPEETSVIEKLLCVEFEGRNALKEQLNHTKVIGNCSCGCRSILLSSGSLAPMLSPSQRIPVEMESMDDDGVPVLFLLHVIEGYVSELEVFRADSEPLIKIPDVSDAVVTAH